MSSRIGAVTGKGLSDLIREEFGFRVVTFFLMAALFATNSRQDPLRYKSSPAGTSSIENWCETTRSPDAKRRCRRYPSCEGSL